jgi:hypothetical protein
VTLPGHSLLVLLHATFTLVFDIGTCQGTIFTTLLSLCESLVLQWCMTTGTVDYAAITTMNWSMMRPLIMNTPTLLFHGLIDLMVLNISPASDCA